MTLEHPDIVEHVGVRYRLMKLIHAGEHADCHMPDERRLFWTPDGVLQLDQDEEAVMDCVSMHELPRVPSIPLEDGSPQYLAHNNDTKLKEGDKVLLIMGRYRFGDMDLGFRIIQADAPPVTLDGYRQIGADAYLLSRADPQEDA